MARPVVTFDVGQTLVDLDLDFLATRLAERGVAVAAQALVDAAPAAWHHYDELVDAGVGHPWRELMSKLLSGAGIAEPGALVDWLYTQQATRNLWRRPIEPMLDLVRELRGKGVAIAALSNSEGHLRDLLEEIELAPLFDAVVDSGRVGIAKPDPRLFAYTLEVLAVTPSVVVHIGDSWSADVEGALAAGWHAIWYRSRAGVQTRDARVPIAHDAAETRAALSSFGI